MAFGLWWRRWPNVARKICIWMLFFSCCCSSQCARDVINLDQICVFFLLAASKTLCDIIRQHECANLWATFGSYVCVCISLLRKSDAHLWWVRARAHHTRFVRSFYIFMCVPYQSLRCHDLFSLHIICFNYYITIIHVTGNGKDVRHICERLTSHVSKYPVC